MKLSVLVSTYNGIKDLPDFFASLAKNIEESGCNAEVIVRDDNSSDGSADYIIKNHPWVRVIKGKITLGFVKSNNLAFAESSGDVICCLNQDTVLSTDFIMEGLDIFDKYPGAAGINTNMIMPWIMTKDEFLRRKKGELPCWEYQFCEYGFAKYLEVAPEIRETNFMTGGAFFLRRSALVAGEELFDPAIHMYCEDTDLSMRLLNRGQKILYSPRAIVFHNQAEKSLTALSSLKKFIKITCTRFSVLAKHQSPKDFFKHYPCYLFGIIKKMDHLGLPLIAGIAARCAGLILVFLFCLIFPYWLWQSSK